jgi:hypothetical protein
MERRRRATGSRHPFHRQGGLGVEPSADGGPQLGRCCIGVVQQTSSEPVVQPCASNHPGTACRRCAAQVQLLVDRTEPCMPPTSFIRPVGLGCSSRALISPPGRSGNSGCQPGTSRVSGQGASGQFGHGPGGYSGVRRVATRLGLSRMLAIRYGREPAAAVNGCAAIDFGCCLPSPSVSTVKVSRAVLAAMAEMTQQMLVKTATGSQPRSPLL